MQEELLLTSLPAALRPVPREEITEEVVEQLKALAEQQKEKEAQVTKNHSVRPHVWVLLTCYVYT